MSSARSQEALQAEYHGYVQLAAQYIRQPRPAIIITHGLSGGGKTTVSGALAELVDAIRIRTDIERKRARGLNAQAHSGSDLERGLYAPEVTWQLYLRLSSLAGSVARAGYVVIIDGAFLKRRQRDLFRSLAADLGIPFVIIAISADVEMLRERITRRAQREHDASEATLGVLEWQRRSEEPIAPDERPFTVVYEADAPLVRARQVASWHGVLDKIGRLERPRPQPPHAGETPPWR